MKLDTYHNLIFLAVLSFIVFSFSSIEKGEPKIEPTLEEICIDEPIDREQLNEENVLFYIKQINIDNPDIVFAQVILETGHLKSKRCIENNNLFGMRHPKTRPTLSKGEKDKHAYFNSWKESVIDYALWQSSFARKLNEEDFYKYLNRVYAEDTLYVTKLKNIVKRNNGIRK